MATKVFQFGLLPPTDGDHIVRQQLRAAHDYRNDLVAIERGRRAALRAVDEADPAVQEAVSLVRAATRSNRRQALHALAAARKAARANQADELARIAELDASIRRHARTLTTCFWGTYLDVEARHQQARQAPLYGDNGLDPSDPAFQRGPRWKEAFASDDPRTMWWLQGGQVGIQLQGGLSTLGALSGSDRRVRLELGQPTRKGRRFGLLHLRVGSDGRDPVWASWPIKTHRDIPALATWKWVRVSVRPEGLRERWTVEITADLPESSVREGGHGAACVEWEWSPTDAGIRVARWVDDAGERGEVVLAASIATGITKPNGIRAVRDTIMNAMRDELVKLIASERSDLPRAVLAESSTMHLWKSPQRFRALIMQWRRLAPAASKSFAALDAWEKRDAHLYAYEAGARAEALRERREAYRLIAAKWRKRYGKVLLSDQDLSKEARWGDDGDVRFTAGVSELRQCLRHAFGPDAIDARWRDSPSENEERSWCERTSDAWVAGGARGDGRFAPLREKTTNAWAARRAKRKPKEGAEMAARDPDGNIPKTQAS